MAETQAEAGQQQASTGLPSIGQSSTGESSAGQSSAGESSTGESSTGESSTGESSAGQSSAGQSSAGQSSAGQSSAGQSSAGQSSAGEHGEGEAGAGQAGAQYGAGPEPVSVGRPPIGAIHHLELWVPNLDRAIVSWGWLLTALGYRMFQDWPGGRSWQSGHAYIVVEQSPARIASRHDRCRPGLNHLAFHVPSRQQVDQLTAEALLHGWKLMFSDLHPYAGGPQHYAAYLENSDGFEAELVADYDS